MEIINTIVKFISFTADSLAIFASGIAIYIFLCKSKQIKTAFNMLLNWSFQLTLTDLRSKIERLNEYNAKEQTDIDEIRNILHEIAGQLRGNQQLTSAAPDLAQRVERLAGSKNLTEPLKRSMVSEIRETLRNIEVNSIASQKE